MRQLLLLLLTLTVVFCLQSCSHQENEIEEEVPRPVLKNYNVPLNQLIDDQKEIKIAVKKSDFTITVIQDGQVLKQYPIVLGKNPKDDKRMEGDYCTPEGQFKMRDKYPHRKWNKFIWLNYPTQESYEKHQQAKKQGQIPENATVGSEIGIHGVPEGKNHWVDNLENWTWGCISMKNDDLDEIYPYINTSTLILIK